MAHPLRTFQALASLLLAAALAAACGGGGGAPAGGGGADFRATSSIPAEGAQNVALDTVVRVTFSNPIDPPSIKTNSLRVGVVGSGEIPGTTALFDDGSGRTLEWTGTTGLLPVETHAVQIDGGLRSTDGDLVEGDRQITFRTGGGLPPVPLPEPSQLRATLGRLNVGRSLHTATRLGDGRVLVAGGYTQSTSATDRAERFDPTSETFSLLAGTMVQRRAEHTATRLADGRVLLAGGLFESAPGQTSTTPKAEVYDPTTGTFSAVGDLAVERYDHAAVRLPDGRVLVTGGSRTQGAGFQDLASAEIFDPATNTFTLLAESMVHTHAEHVMADLGTGRIAIVGGSDVDLRPEYYDIATGTFVAFQAAPQDGVRFGAMGASFASGALCVAGGDDRGTVLYLDNATTTLLNSGSPLAEARAYGTATRIANDRILVAGGFDLDRGFFLLQSLDLVVEGGIGGSRTYATSVTFPVSMAMHAATRLADGRVLFTGGLNEDGAQPNRDVAFLFTP